MNNNPQFRNLIWNIVGTTVNAFMSLIYQIIVARVNGVADTGSFSVCFAFSLLLYTFSNLGNRVFEVADHDGNDDTYYTLKLGTAVLSLLFVWLFVCFSGYTPGRAALLFVLVLVRIIESFSDTIYALWQKAERLDLVGMSYVIKNIVSIGAFVLVDILTHSLLLSALGMLVGTVAVYIVFDRTISAKLHRFKPDRSGRACLQLCRRISYYIAFNFVAMLISNLPKFIADFRYTDSQIGYFSILIMIPTFLTLLGQMIVQSFLTKITVLYRTRNLAQMHRLAVILSGAMAAVGAVICVGAYLLGAPVLKLVYGLDFESFKPDMLTAVCIGIINAMVYIVSAVLTVMGRSRQQFYLNIAALSAEIGILYFGMSGNTVLGALIAFLAAIATELGIFAGYYKHILKQEIIAG